MTRLKPDIAPYYVSILRMKKHPSVESDNSSGWAMSSSVTVPTGNRLSDDVSKSFVGGRSCATSIGGQIVSISCRTRMSLSECFGAACKAEVPASATVF